MITVKLVTNDGVTVLSKSFSHNDEWKDVKLMLEQALIKEYGTEFNRHRFLLSSNSKIRVNSDTWINVPCENNIITLRLALPESIEIDEISEEFDSSSGYESILHDVEIKASFLDIQKEFKADFLACPLPASVNRNVHPYVDLRLPHSNPLLEDKTNPIRIMSSNIVDVFKTDDCKSILLLGSSGCGKSSAAFCVASEVFSIYLEVSDSSQQYNQGYNILRDVIFADSNKGLRVTFADLCRRLYRMISARLLLLLSASKKESSCGRKLTPYQWLLYSLSDMFQIDLDAYMKQLAKLNVSSGFIERLLHDCKQNLGSRVLIMFDEAHLFFVEDVFFKFDAMAVDSFQAVVLAVDQISVKYLHGTMYFGTQITLAQSVRLASAVGKCEKHKKLLVFGSYPYLRAFDNLEDPSVEKSLKLCLSSSILKNDNEFIKLCAILSGRPRITSNFILQLIETLISIRDSAHYAHAIENPIKTVLDKMRYFVINQFLEEVKRLQSNDDTRLDQSHLLTLLVRITCPWSLSDSSKIITTGTLLCTKRIVMSDEQFIVKFSTGGELRPYNKENPIKVRFIYSYEEPLLGRALERYLMAENDSSILKKRKYVKSWYDNCLETLSSGDNTSRGNHLDLLMLYRAIDCCKGEPYFLTDYLGLTNLTEMGVMGTPQFCIKSVVGGAGMLNVWIHMIVNNPDEDIIPGLPARNAAIRPEQNAGADGVFAAFTERKVTIVSIVCAWNEAGVDREKWRDQEKKSFLNNQFGFAKDGILLQHHKELVKILQDNKKKVDFARILVELPERQTPKNKSERVQENNIYKGALVVNYKNSVKILKLAKAK